MFKYLIYYIIVLSFSTLQYIKAECKYQYAEEEIPAYEEILNLNPKFAQSLDYPDCMCDNYLWVENYTVICKGKFVGDEKKYVYKIKTSKIDTIPPSIKDFKYLYQLKLEDANIEYIPVEIGKLKKIYTLNLERNKIKIIPNEIFDASMETLLLENNLISEVPDSVKKFKGNLALMNNRLTKVSDSIAVSLIRKLGLSNNLLTELPKNLEKTKYLNTLLIEHNKLTFEDIEPFFPMFAKIPEGHWHFAYAPQDSIHENLTIYLKPGESTFFGSWCGGSKNEYQWYHQGQPATFNNSIIDYAFGIHNISHYQYGAYTCAVTNDSVPDLTIWRRTVHVLPEPSIKIKAKALLEGVFDTSTYLMENTLYQKELLPTDQPFNQAPWFYEGEECVGDYENIPDNILDWVLMEVRDMFCPEEVIEQRAGFITTTGDIVGMDYQKGIDFYELSETGYYISIKTRTHLAVMTKKAHKVPNDLAIDFSDPITIKGGASQLADLERGFYALLAGDFNSDGVISVDDFIEYKDQTAILNEYIDSDCNLDATVTVSDYNLYLLNVSKIGVMEIRYE